MLRLIFREHYILYYEVKDYPFDVDLIYDSLCTIMHIVVRQFDQHMFIWKSDDAVGVEFKEFTQPAVREFCEQVCKLGYEIQ